MMYVKKYEIKLKRKSIIINNLNREDEIYEKILKILEKNTYIILYNKKIELKIDMNNKIKQTSRLYNMKWLENEEVDTWNVLEIKRSPLKKLRR